MINFSGLSNLSPSGRAIRLPLGLLPQQTVVPILQGPLRGSRWLLGSGTHGCWLGTYELPKQLAIASQIRPSDVIYDIGANVGIYTLLFSKLVGAGGRVFAFEPLPRNLEYLRRHIKINRVANVAVLDVALSNAEGVASFDPGPGPSQGGLSEAGCLRVRVVTLDGLLAGGTITPP